MQRTIVAALGAASVLVGAASLQTLAQPAAPGTQEAMYRDGTNVGSLGCHVAGGVGFIFGSSKDLDCLFTRTDGVAERYIGSIKRFGMDIGYTKSAHMVWWVFAPGSIAPGSLDGTYTGVTAQATVVVGAGTNVLVGGGNKQISLQPVSVEGSKGLNVAAGIGEIVLEPVHPPGR
jgi:hypothetical protein